MSDRTTIDFILPECGDKIVMYEKFSHGDLLHIREALLEDISVNVDDPQSPKISNLSGKIALKTKKVATKLLIVKVLKADGVEVVDIDSFLYNLSIRDGEALSDKIEEIDNNSKLTPDAKKK